MEGPLRRKTLLKEGKKPTVSDYNYSCGPNALVVVIIFRIRLNLQLDTTQNNGLSTVIF